MFEGLFRGDMFDRPSTSSIPIPAQTHDSGGSSAKDANSWRIYRPALVVGDSRTGEMDKIDGPYYFFKLIQKMRNLRRPGCRPSVSKGRINVDAGGFSSFAAVDHRAHAKAKAKCFHLVDPTPCASAICSIPSPAPPMRRKWRCASNAACSASFPRSTIRRALLALTPVRRIQHAVMKDLGLPDDMFRFIIIRPASTAGKRCGCSGHRHRRCHPSTPTPGLWDYWSAISIRIFSSTAASRPRWREGGTGHRRVFGDRQGDGKKLAEAGAIVVTMARDKDQLDETVREFDAAGLKLHALTSPTSPTWSSRKSRPVSWPITAPSMSWSTTLASDPSRHRKQLPSVSPTSERTMQLNYFRFRSQSVGCCRQ